MIYKNYKFLRDSLEKLDELNEDGVHTPACTEDRISKRSCVRDGVRKYKQKKQYDSKLSHTIIT